METTDEAKLEIINDEDDKNHSSATGRSRDKKSDFKRLARGRVQRSISALRSLRKLANTNHYKYTIRETGQIMAALKSEISKLENAFRAGSEHEGGKFKYSGPGEAVRGKRDGRRALHSTGFAAHVEEAWRLWRCDCQHLIGCGACGRARQGCTLCCYQGRGEPLHHRDLRSVFPEVGSRR